MLTDLISYITSQLSTNELAIAGVLTSTLGTIFYKCFDYIKNSIFFIKNRITRLLIYSVTIEQSDVLYLYTSKYLTQTYPNKLRNIEYKLDEYNQGYDYQEDEHNITSNKLIKAHHEDIFYTFKYGRFLTIIKEREKLDNASNFTKTYMGRVIIKGLLAKKAIDKLVDEIITMKIEDELNKTKHSIDIYDYSYHWEAREFHTFKSMDNMFLDIKQDIIDDLDEFIDNKELYKQRGIIYKRSHIYEGGAGLGKTQMAFAIAKKYNRPIYLFNLSSMVDAEFKKALTKVKPNSICLFDDSDIDLSGREREVGSKNVSLQTLLGSIDGAQTPTDVIFIFTTNDISKYDEALLRKGRMDAHFTFTKPSDKQCNLFIKNFFNLDFLPNFTEYDTKICDLQDKCLKITLKSDNKLKIEQQLKQEIFN